MSNATPIKQEPTNTTPGELEDDLDAVDETYEDSLDLDMSREDTKVWLVRLPKFLMEKWKDVESNSGKELGKVRIDKSSAGSGNQPWKVKLVLNDTQEAAGIPHEYDIALVKQVVDNTFVFSEKDMPKYDKQTAVAPKPKPATPAPSQKPNKFNRFNFKERYTPYVKTIPKRTALVGTVCHECMVTPSLTDKGYSNVVRKRKRQQDDPALTKVTLLSEPPGVTSGTFSQSLRGKQSMFMRAQKKDPKASAEGKATRMPRNDLLDLLFRLFEEFDYWSLKGLKDRTKQPEVYLKEVLETMAVLIKKGPYAMRYSLKPEYKQMKNKRKESGGAASGESFSQFIEKNAAAAASGAAGGAGAADAGAGDAAAEDENEDDDEDMEDVV